MKSLNRKTANITTQHPIKVLQFGEGNFLRAFVDWIIDTINEKAGFNGSVEIIQPLSNGLGPMLNAQEGLYHVVLNGIKNGKASKEARLVTCVTGVINPYEDFKKYLTSGENPDLKFVVSNTTEAGIAFDANDSSPDLLPNSFPGKLAVLLIRRFNHFKGASDKGLTFFPCELIDKNGDALKAALLQYVTHWKLPEDFKQWLITHNTFCNTLVDRIVPGFPKDTIQEVQQEIGYSDNLVVLAEPFHLWVIEGPDDLRKQFPVEKANLEVKFVKDMAPYRTRKVRILNGAHTSLVPVAYLSGLRTVRESVEDGLIGNFLKKTIFEEIIPTLDLPENELKQFANDVIERFQNPFIKHELSSIALNSISKYKVRVLPSLLEYKKRKGKLPTRLVFSLACLIRFYKGTWRSETLPVNDSPEIMDFFKKLWTNQPIEQIVKETLSNLSFWDEDLTKIDGLAQQVVADLKYIQEYENKSSTAWPK